MDEEKKDNELIPFFDVTEDKMQHIIKVIGVGRLQCREQHVQRGHRRGDVCGVQHG